MSQYVHFTDLSDWMTADRKRDVAELNLETPLVPTSDSTSDSLSCFFMTPTTAV